MAESSTKVTRDELNNILKSLITKEINEDTIDVAIQIIKLGADPNTTSEDGETILFSVMGLKDFLKLKAYTKILLEHGASLWIKSVQDNKVERMLKLYTTVCAPLEYSEFVNELKEKQSQQRQKYTKEMKSFMHCGNPLAYKIKINKAINLIKLGADPHVPVLLGLSIIHLIASETDDCNLLEQYHKLGCDIHIKHNGNKAIDYVNKGKINMIRWFLENGIDVNERIGRNNTRLHNILHNICRFIGSDEIKIIENIIKLYIEKGASLLLKNDDGHIPLDIVKSKCLKLELLITETKKQAEEEMSQLIKSKELDDAKINRALELIGYGADPNKIYIIEDNPRIDKSILMSVSIKAKADIIKEFIACGCNINQVDNDLNKAIDYAIFNDNLDLARWYLQNGIAPNENVVKEEAGFMTRLHRYLTVVNPKYDVFEVIKILVENGTDLLLLRSEKGALYTTTYLAKTYVKNPSKEVIVKYLTEKEQEQLKKRNDKNKEDNEKVTKVLEWKAQGPDVVKINKEKVIKELTETINRIKLFEKNYKNGYIMLNKIINHINSLKPLICKKNYINHIKQNMKKYMKKFNSEDTEKLKGFLEKLYEEIIKYVHSFDDLNVTLMDILIMLHKLEEYANGLEFIDTIFSFC
jgi:ankyrin repeat protein